MYSNLFNFQTEYKDIQDMQEENQQALVIDEYAGEVHLKTIPRPKPEKDQLLIEVQASTINPSDLIFLDGRYFKRPLPSVCGIEGTGKVVAVGNQSLDHWKGKRVSFVSFYGTWCQYSVCTVMTCFQIPADLDIQTAASGVVNPLTVAGFIEEYRRKNRKGGIIHTGAASNLGKMLNRLCKAEQIPLLGIVRRQQSADVMVKEGITDIVVTNEEGWEKKLKAIVDEKKYDCLFDALGGGPVLDKILQNIDPTSGVYIYGVLENSPFVISNPTLFFAGMNINNFLIFPWFAALDEESKIRVRQNHADHLKSQLFSVTGLTVPMSDIKKGLEFAAKNAADGKVLIQIRK